MRSDKFMYKDLAVYMYSQRPAFGRSHQALPEKQDQFPGTEANNHHHFCPYCTVHTVQVIK